MGVYIWTNELKNAYIGERDQERPDIDSYSLKGSKLSPVSAPHWIAVSSDKSKLYLVQANWYVYQYWMTGGDISTLTSAQSSSPSAIYSRWLYIKPDGTKLYSVSDNNYKYDITLPTPFSLSGWSFSTYTNNLWISSPTWCWFTPDGKYVYICSCNSPKAIYKVPLTKAWDMAYSTATWMTSISTVSAVGTYPYNVAISPTWLKMFVWMFYGSTSISQFNLTTPRDITTAAYSWKYLSVTERWEFTVSEDGTIYLTNANSSTTIYQYWV